jgi:hypothetical protein
MGYNLFFLIFFEELLYVAMWLKLPKGCKAGCQKELCFVHRTLDFHCFSLFDFTHGLYDVIFNVTARYGERRISL